MAAQWPVSRWVETNRDRVGFGLQVFPIDTPTNPAAYLLAASRLADDLGFDAFFVGDHPAWGLECWLHLSAIAMITKRIRLGTMVSCVGYRPPVMTARIVADLDNLSQGRIILGLGIGWDENEFVQLGLPYPPVPERQEALEEAINIIRGTWGDAPFTFHGRYYQTKEIRVLPVPVQRPHPPLLLAGGGERVTLRQVAQYADACNLFAYGAGLLSAAITPTDVQRKHNALLQHCTTIERPFETILRTYSTGWLILSEDETRLKEKLQHYFPDGLEKRYSGSWANFVVARTPEQAITYFQSLVDAGVQYFVVETLDAADIETMHLLAEQVIPHVQPKSMG